MKNRDLNFFLDVGKKCFVTAAYLPLIAGLLWSIGLCVCRPICTLLPVITVLINICLKSKFRITVPMTASLTAIVLGELVLFNFLSAPAREIWDKQWSHPSQASLNGDILHLRNIRDFEFYSPWEYDERYLTEDFNLKELCAVHLIESRSHGIIPGCDLLFSFVFRDGRNLAFGPELKLPVNQQLNEVQSLYKSYGLLYVFGTEEDLLRLRSQKKHEYLSFHTLRITPEQAQNMLLACIRLAEDTPTDKAYPPYLKKYCGSMQQILRAVHPELRHVLNEEAAHELYTAGILETAPGETWETYQRRCSIGFKISDNRDDYSAAIRRHTGAAPLPPLVAKRTVQQENKAASSTRKAQLGAQAETLQADEQHGTAPAKQYVTPFTTSKGKSLAEKIPEPGERLNNDTRDYSDEEYNSEGSTSRISSATGTVNEIQEPGERMRADERAARNAAEQKEKERKAAAEGRFKKINADGRKEPVSDVDYDALLLGRKSSGIKIIEKKKAEEEAHPLDPYKRRTPFDEEKQKQKANEEEIDDLSAKPKPLHL